MDNGGGRSLIGLLAFSALGLAGIAGYEGYSGKATQPLPGDKCTYGIGSTVGPDGKPVRCGEVITPPRAIVLAVRDVSIKEERLKRCINAKLYQHEYDAFVSLAYNVGTEAVCNSSIPRKLEAGNYAAACATILEFDGFRDRSKPKVKNARTGKLEYPLVKIRGLTLRRQGEYQRCMGEANG